MCIWGFGNLNGEACGMKVGVEYETSICVQYCSCWWEPHAAVGVRKDH